MDKQKILDAVIPEVKKSLKSPYSAVFCSPEELRIKQSGNEYEVLGYVDSQNSYGAMLRVDFEYYVKKDDNGEFIATGSGGVGDERPSEQLNRSRRELEEVTKQCEEIERSNAINGYIYIAIIVIVLIAFFSSIK